MTYNRLSLLRRTPPPEPLSKARPKLLPFQVLCRVGELVSHAGKLLVRVVRPAGARPDRLPGA